MNARLTAASLSQRAEFTIVVLGAFGAFIATSAIEVMHVAESIPEGEIRQHATKELAPNRQIKQHVVVSVVVFIASLVLTFYPVNGRI